MGQTEKKTQGSTTRLGVLSIPDVMLETAGIPSDSDLIVEILPGVLLIGAGQPLWQASRPYLKLFDNLGIEPGGVTATLEKRGYSDEQTDL